MFNWPKYEIIKEVNGEKVLYLRRYFIWRSSMFNIFLHKIAMPDQDKDVDGNHVSHNHPWNFIGIILRGGYTEGMYSDWNKYITLYRGLFSWAFRKAEDFHKILEVKPNTWTLIFTGPIKNDVWKFWTSKGKINWRDHLGIYEDVEMD